MVVKLKPIAEQVVVITGASSGIGLVTARIAASQGASVVLAARNRRDLEAAVERFRQAGGKAAHCVADVTDPEQVEEIANTAIREFGRIDTWVNNAGVSLYGRIMEIPLADQRRQFDVLYWGHVHGSRTAVPHLSRQGGALINVASALADRAIPLQGPYCAAKHAVKGFTESLRMELEDRGAPISVSLVKPSSINTPFFKKGRSYLGFEPQPLPPVFAPELVARAIISCAQRPTRDIIAGGLGKLLSLSGLAPGPIDRYMLRTTFAAQCSAVPLAADRKDNLYEPVEHDGGERGGWEGRTKESSFYTAAVLRRGIAGAIGASLATATVGVEILGRAVRARMRRSPRRLAERAGPSGTGATGGK
jgi:NAD(P)-dependent dehydrogenase (short-subunit alcohol dehydrogenase family)